MFARGVRFGAGFDAEAGNFGYGVRRFIMTSAQRGAVCSGMAGFRNFGLRAMSGRTVGGRGIHGCGDALRQMRNRGTVPV